MKELIALLVGLGALGITAISVPQGGNGYHVLAVIGGIILGLIAMYVTIQILDDLGSKK
jgi:hypothetical protein